MESLSFRSLVRLSWLFHQCPQQVSIVITKFNDFTWLLSIMYASTNYWDKRTLWQEVTALID